MSVDCFTKYGCKSYCLWFNLIDINKWINVQALVLSSTRRHMNCAMNNRRVSHLVVIVKIVIYQLTSKPLQAANNNTKVNSSNDAQTDTIYVCVLLVPCTRIRAETQ